MTTSSSGRPCFIPFFFYQETWRLSALPTTHTLYLQGDHFPCSPLHLEQLNSLPLMVLQCFKWCYAFKGTSELKCIREDFRGMTRYMHTALSHEQNEWQHLCWNFISSDIYCLTFSPCYNFINRLVTLQHTEILRWKQSKCHCRQITDIFLTCRQCSGNNAASIKDVLSLANQSPASFGTKWEPSHAVHLLADCILLIKLSVPAFILYFSYDKSAKRCLIHRMQACFVSVYMHWMCNEPHC